MFPQYSYFVEAWKISLEHIKPKLRVSLFQCEANKGTLGINY